jgi:hypothetical protein
LILKGFGEIMKINKNLTLTALFIASFTTIASADVTEVIKKQYAFDQDGKIELSNINGDVSIIACGCNEVNLIATITASDQATRDRIKVDIDSSESNLSVETKYIKQKDSFFNRNSHSKVTYDLSVPNDVFLKDISLINGDLNISGVTGKLNADLINGELKSDGMTSSTKINMINGNMDITFESLENAHKIKLESINGAIIVRIPSDANVKVAAETISGNISNDFGIKVHKGRYIGSDMHGVIGDGSVKLSMNNINGRIKLKTL